MGRKEERQVANDNGNIIELHGVTVMQEDNIVLRDVNFEVAAGEFVYIIGRVGSGKSSLLKTLYSELPFDGRVGFVAGYDLNDIKMRDVPFLRRRMGIVFQDFQLLSDRSVYDNLEFVLKATGWKKKAEMDKRIRDVLAQVDMINKGYKKPHQLSGGEQQRIAIARALLNSPALILADEPTGNLDPDTTEELMQLLLKINNDGKTIVMATHNHNVITKFRARTLECENSMLIAAREEDIVLNTQDENPYTVEI
ncbi:MAG: ATP-binding cassette domain-containing protein [Bacteroidales bacterium]|nr:ATP-binding cassette domain-containing protein [Bacteroidales bacterium]